MISLGDYIAGGMATATVGGIIVREWRASIAAGRKEATDKTLVTGITTELTAKIELLFGKFRDLDERRQKHELECARVQERTAGILARTTESLDRQGREIGHLQAQVRNVVTGSAGRVVEIVPGPQP